MATQSIHDPNHQSLITRHIIIPSERFVATLSLAKLTKHFGKVTAVDGIDVEVPHGEFLCILGPSGCGKTTALRMIAGFEEPTAGDIRIDGASVTALGPNRRPTAMVFQKYTLWPHMTVYDNIAFGLKLRKLNRSDIQRKVAEGLDLVGLAGYEERYPSQLSGGQQQRVALARALVLEPKILLLDEPFSSLDALLRVNLREELRRIQSRLNITAIFVTHDQEEALSLADRIALMNSGRVEQMDEPSTLYASPRTLFAASFIGVMNLLPAQVADQYLHVGKQTLRRQRPVSSGSSLTVGIRPEDFSVVPSTAQVDGSDVWRGRVEQTMDMGHYRKVLVDVEGFAEPIKAYLAKSIDVHKNETIALYPNRYLVYNGAEMPVEVRQTIGD
ncbi:ATP-binding cassette domain-containing protein [bacterium]|nr:ATP-binding cassette domain-containing protein [bacterium]